MSARTLRLIVLALLALALAVRLIAVAHYPYKPINDAVSYLRTARSIANHGLPRDHNHAAGRTHGPSAYFPPAFSYLLSVIYVISHGPALGHTAVQLARCVQALLGTITVALIGLVALELFGGTTALAAIAIAAVYPVFIEESTIIVAENLLTALEVGALYAALRTRRASKPLRWVVGTGVLVGLAALTHTNATLLLIPLGFAVKDAGESMRRPHLPPALLKMAAALLMVVAALLTITPWLVRDAIVMHHFVPISTENGITLAGTYNSTSAASSPPYRWHIFYGVPSLTALIPKTRRLTEIQESAKLQSAALRYIGKHPLAPISVIWHNTLRLLELEGSHAWKLSAAAAGLEFGVARIGVVSFWLLMLFALAGFATRTARSIPRWLWGIPLVMWLSVAPINAETPRFREPLDPFAILLAATAVMAIVRWLARSWARRPATHVEREVAAA